MDERFVFVSVLVQTREDLRAIARSNDTNIYKIIRDFARSEREKIQEKSNASVNVAANGERSKYEYE